MNWVFDFDDLKFEANIIVAKYNTSEIRIPLNEIWTMFYAKWSLKNGLVLWGLLALQWDACISQQKR